MKTLRQERRRGRDKVTHPMNSTNPAAVRSSRLKWLIGVTTCSNPVLPISKARHAYYQNADITLKNADITEIIHGARELCL